MLVNLNPYTVRSVGHGWSSWVSPWGRQTHFLVLKWIFYCTEYRESWSSLFAIILALGMLLPQFPGFWHASVTSITPTAILASAAATFCRQRSTRLKSKASRPLCCIPLGMTLIACWGTLIQDQLWPISKPSKNYLILYRQKEVLACADSIEAEMDQLLTLLNLLLILQKSTDSPLW
jgi:hypothetical protein